MCSQFDFEKVAVNMTLIYNEAFLHTNAHTNLLRLRFNSKIVLHYILNINIEVFFPKIERYSSYSIIPALFILIANFACFHMIYKRAFAFGLTISSSKNRNTPM